MILAEEPWRMWNGPAARAEFGAARCRHIGGGEYTQKIAISPPWITTLLSKKTVSSELNHGESARNLFCELQLGGLSTAKPCSGT